MDGLAPRYITRAAMPALTTLALEGASCFTARTVTPPLTLPVHTSMLRGVDPSTHGSLDNTSAPSRTDAPSFLQAARDAGRLTATFVNWLPLDAVIERDAAKQRFVIDGGYDPDEDRRAVDAAVAAVADGRCDLVFVYLSHPDVDGHTHGWGSAEYAASVTRSDTELARLLDAAGPEASVLVTTDHGGLGTSHDDEVADVLETFVVVRAPGRVPAASGWPTASSLDVAPTVADLCGVAPDPRWEGTSLLGSELLLVEVVLDLLTAAADESYGERVTMLDHALQSAALAAADDAGDEMVLACLLHDLGHLLGQAGEWGLPDHAEVAARALQPLLPPAVVEPIRGHIQAKRYSVAVDPAYDDRLSVASKMSLTEQGGPLPPDEAEAFAAGAFAAEAMRLRGYDDGGKVGGLTIAPLGTYRSLITAALAPKRPINPSWARDACRCGECRDPGNDQHLIDASALDGWTVVRTDRTKQRPHRHPCTTIRVRGTSAASPPQNPATCLLRRGRRRSRSNCGPTAPAGPVTIMARSSISWPGGASLCSTTAGPSRERSSRSPTRSGSCAKPTTAPSLTSSPNPIPSTSPTRRAACPPTPTTPIEIRAQPCSCCTVWPLRATAAPAVSSTASPPRRACGRRIPPHSGRSPQPTPHSATTAPRSICGHGAP